MQSRQADQTPEVPRNLLALKSMVIGMAGLLVLAALILIGVGISRMGGDGPKAAGFDPASLPLAPGCQLGAVIAEGDRLVIPIEGHEACRRIIIADMETGRVIGEFLFPTAP